jgi:hypothetical protein
MAADLDASIDSDGVVVSMTRNSTPEAAIYRSITGRTLAARPLPAFGFRMNEYTVVNVRLR